MCIYIYINIFSFVVESFAECHCGHVDECSGDSCMNYNYIRFISITLYYTIILYCITSYFYCTTYLQFI